MVSALPGAIPNTNASRSKHPTTVAGCRAWVDSYRSAGTIQRKRDHQIISISLILSFETTANIINESTLLNGMQYKRPESPAPINTATSWIEVSDTVCGDRQPRRGGIIRAGHGHNVNRYIARTQASPLRSLLLVALLDKDVSIVL